MVHALRSTERVPWEPPHGSSLGMGHHPTWLSLLVVSRVSSNFPTLIISRLISLSSLVRQFVFTSGYSSPHKLATSSICEASHTISPPTRVGGSNRDTIRAGQGLSEQRHKARIIHYGVSYSGLISFGTYWQSACRSYNNIKGITNKSLPSLAAHPKLTPLLQLSRASDRRIKSS